VFPGTIGPKEGNGAAIVDGTSAAKIAALHIVLTRRECTVGLTSAWYARLFLDERKIFGAADIKEERHVGRCREFHDKVKA
jgi:hypothetical protein